MSKQIASNLPRGIKTSYYFILTFAALITTLGAIAFFPAEIFEGNFLSYLTLPNVALFLALLLPILLTILLLRKIKNNKADNGLIMLFSYYQAFFNFLFYYDTEIRGYNLGSKQNFWDFMGSAWGMFTVALVFFFFLSLLFKALLSLSEKGSIITLLLGLNMVLVVFFMLVVFVDLMGIFLSPLLLLFLGTTILLILDVYRLHKKGEFFKKTK